MAPSGAFLGDILLALFCGALTSLAPPRLGLCLVAWFSLAPLFTLWRRAKDWRQSFLIGWAAGFGYHATSLCWIYSLCRFAGLSAFVGILALGSLALLLALNWGIIGILGRRFAERTGVLRPWAWAIMWTAVTVVCERWTPRFCADLMCYTQWRYTALLQISAWTGPHFLGFLLIAANAAIERAWQESGKGKAQPATACNLALVMALVGGTWAYGVYELARRPVSGSAWRVEILQPNVDQYQKFDAQYADSISKNFAELLGRPRSGVPDLIVWPESSLPYWVRVGRDIPEAAVWGRKLGAHQIIGAVSQEGEISRNSAFCITPSGAVSAVYHKRQLVPFGEFVPIPFLGRYIGILNQMGGLTPGEARQPLLATPLGPVAAGICYEALFPRLSRLDAGRGAKIIVNITNDGWYKDTWCPYQHFQINAFRAVENRVTVIRCANTGISGIIDPWGLTTARLDLNARGRLDAEVPQLDMFPGRSFYARHGDWFGILTLFSALGMMLVGLRRP